MNNEIKYNSRVFAKCFTRETIDSEGNSKYELVFAAPSGKQIAQQFDTEAEMEEAYAAAEIGGGGISPKILAEYVKKEELIEDLKAYYLKTETYSKTEVNNLINAIERAVIRKVNELPQTGESNIIYLVPAQDGKTGDEYDEYIWTDSKFEKIGSTRISLDGYATEQYVDDAISEIDIPEYTAGTNMEITNENVINNTIPYKQDTNKQGIYIGNGINLSSLPASTWDTVIGNQAQTGKNAQSVRNTIIGTQAGVDGYSTVNDSIALGAYAKIKHSYSMSFGTWASTTKNNQAMFGSQYNPLNEMAIYTSSGVKVMATEDYAKEYTNAQLDKRTFLDMTFVTELIENEDNEPASLEQEDIDLLTAEITNIIAKTDYKVNQDVTVPMRITNDAGIFYGELHLLLSTDDGALMGGGFLAHNSEDKSFYGSIDVGDWKQSGLDNVQFTVESSLVTNLTSIYGQLHISMYDSNITYSVGDYVYRYMDIYKCNTAISTPEDFDTSKWDVINIETYLQENLGGSSNVHIIDGGTQANPVIINDLEPGIYYFTTDTFWTRAEGFSDVSNYDVKGATGYFISKKYSEVTNGETFGYALTPNLSTDDTNGIILQGVTLVKLNSWSGVAQSGWRIADVSGFVMLNTNQTIAGKKTFRILPESSVKPTTNNQLTNKKYVDDKVAGVSSFDPTIIAGYDNTKTQILKHVNGTLTWVDDYVDGDNIAF